MAAHRPRPPGPASRTLFAVDPADQTEPSLKYDPRFRAELSSVFSQVFFLDQHALTSSTQQGQSLLSYFDHEAYQRACMLYPAFSTPLDDLDACQQHPTPSWKLLYTQANLIWGKLMFDKLFFLKDVWFILNQFW